MNNPEKKFSSDTGMPDEGKKHSITENGDKNQQNSGTGRFITGKRPQTSTSAISKPVVVLFGPKSFGKTALLVRLGIHLSSDDDYSIEPNPDYRLDDGYSVVIKEYKTAVEKNDLAPKATGHIDFLLLDVVHKNQGPVCHILEAPGEDFFTEGTTDDGSEPDYDDQPEYQEYLVDIISADVKHVYVFFLLLQSTDKFRKAYTKRIREFILRHVRRTDEALILFSQCDRNMNNINPKTKRPIIKNFEDHYNRNYKELHEALKSVGVTPSIVPYSSGWFPEVAVEMDDKAKRKKKFVHSDHGYPAELWENIYKATAGVSRSGLFGRLRGR